MSTSVRPLGSGRMRSRLATVTAVVTAAVLALGACSSSGGGGGGGSTGPDTSGGTSPTSSSSSSSGVTVSQAALDKTIKTALGTAVPASKLPPVMVEAFKQASLTLTQAQLDQAYTCWKANSCTLGSGPVSLAEVDGFENTWRDFSKMGLILQALTYPQIGKFAYYNANGSLSAYQSDLRTATANGAKAIVAYNDFGSAAWPAFASAQRSGAVVSTFVGPNDGATASDITTRVQPDICAVGKVMAQITKQAVGNSDVAYFTGVAGNPEDAGWQKCATAAGVHSIYNGVTNWTPAGAQTAASALIASNKPIKAILYSYSNPVPNIVKAYQTANKPIPAIITWTTDNGTLCTLKKTPFPLYLTNALNWGARVSLTAVIDKLDGQTVPASVIYPQPFVKANPADCDPSAPATYPGVSALVPQSLTKKMLSGS